MKSDKPSNIHQIIVSNIINANDKNHVIEPNKFKMLLGRMFHIKKEYAILVLRDLYDSKIISEYSGKEIVFDRKKIDSIFLE